MFSGKNTPKAYRKPSAARMKSILDKLDHEYGIKKPGAKSRPKPMDELILTVLSQNTNDVNRDRAYKALRDKYPEWDDVSRASAEKVEDCIKVGGLAKQKAARIKDILKWAKETRNDPELGFLKKLTPHEAKEVLLSLKGVGDKTAACVMLFSLSMPAFPVDTHIFRIAKRLHFIPENATVGDAHEVMADLVPVERYYSSHINIIEHGRKICHARRPECETCFLRRLCPSRNLFS